MVKYFKKWYIFYHYSCIWTVFVCTNQVKSLLMPQFWCLFINLLKSNLSHFWPNNNLHDPNLRKIIFIFYFYKVFGKKAILYFIISTFNTVLIYVVKHKCHFSSNLSSDLEFKVIRFIMMLEMELGPQIAQAYICIFSVCVYENLI